MSLRPAVFILILLFLALPAAAENYTVFVDREFGFWGVRSDNINHTLTFKNNMLNINTGDSIIWENQDSKSDRVTIISDNMLWENGKALGWEGSRFKFTFNSSGFYNFHIMESSRVILNKTVTYESNVTDENTDEETTEVITDSSPKYENFPYHYMQVFVTGDTVGAGTFPIKKNKPTTTEKNMTTIIENPVNSTSIGYSFGNAIDKIKKVAAAPTPTGTVRPTPVPTEVPMESYQEFTLYEMIKRWYAILTSS
jgi:hypothetical protein